MLQKSLAALLLTAALSSPTLADTTAPLDKEEYAKIRAHALALVEKRLKHISDEFDRNYEAYAKRALEKKLPKVAGSDVDDDDGYDADGIWDFSTADQMSKGDCNSAADGKPGVGNQASDGSNATGNGGKGGTVIIDGKSKSGDCYSANGGDGASNRVVRGDNKSVGNGGDGGSVGPK